MNISEYAAANNLDADTAFAHLLLYDLVEATTGDEQWQRRTFEMLIKAVDASKLASSVKELLKQIVATTPVQDLEPDVAADMIDDALADRR